MIYKQLGNTELVVSSLCLGVLTIGPLQCNLPLEQGADVLAYALKRGINFFDTAKIYKTYTYIKKAIEISDIRPVITTKSYDYTYAGMKSSVEEALDEMGLDYIDIFMLHEQESELTLKGHQDALRYLIEARQKGLVRAVGISTHSVKGVLAGARAAEIEVIHPLINWRGLGIMDGTRDDMLTAIDYAYKRGKGIYAMKALGGGNLIGEAYEAFKFIRDLQTTHSMAVGMKSREEIDLNLCWIEGKRNPELEKRVLGQPRHLLIEEWCQGCGKCTENCRYKALTLKNNKAAVDDDKCILCGYCSRFCDDFCIKIV
ncbi:MAG: aldo/keto reductase [Syntrophomonadaceae bacterium]